LLFAVPFRFFRKFLHKNRWDQGAIALNQNRLESLTDKGFAPIGIGEMLIKENEVLRKLDVS
jgi:hypothetical protein